MVKCSESIVVVQSGLAAKQCVGTRGHPATVTDKTALILSVEVWGGGASATGGTLCCNVTTCRPTQSRSAWIIRGRHDQLCRDRPLPSSVWHSDGRPFSNESPVLMSPSSPSAQWPVRPKNGRALGHRVQCTPECYRLRDWPLSSNHGADRGLDGDEERRGS